MRLNGWTRIAIVLSIGWVVGIAVSAYMEYPRALKDQSDYWLSYANPFDAYDPPEIQEQTRLSHVHSDNRTPPARIEPNVETFLIRGLAPLTLLWLAYGAVIWISRGFTRKADGAN